MLPTSKPKSYHGGIGTEIGETERLIHERVQRIAQRTVCDFSEDEKRVAEIGLGSDEGAADDAPATEHGQDALGLTVLFRGHHS